MATEKGTDCVQKANTHSCDHCEVRNDSLLCSTADIRPEVEKIKTTCHFKTGDVIFRTGDVPQGIYAIQSGLVKLEVHSPTGNAHTLRFVGPAGVLGYRSLFANEPYSASAIAVENCKMCFISKTHILSFFKEFPDFAMRLMSHLSQDLRTAEEKWMDQIDKSSSERVAEALLFLNEHFSHQNWTRREIAQWAGTTPETVIRTLSQFEKEGLVDQSDGRGIRILSKEKLKTRT